MNAIEMMKTNDTDLLKLDQIDDFRAYLESNKCRTRKGNHAQLMHVHTSAGWAPIQKGAGGVVKTPVALRAVINDFLLTPVARSLALAKRISDSNTIPLNAPDLALQVAEVVAAKPANDSGSDYTPGCHSHVVTLQGNTDSRLALGGVQTCENGDHVHDPIAARRRQWAEFGELLQSLKTEGEPQGPHILLSPRLRELAAQGGLMMIDLPSFGFDGQQAKQPAPAVDPVHLEDLRDDFAIHCPLTQREDESLGAFADRRWQYADVMMQKRTPQYAD
jgi:hypothetical protein